MEWAVGWTHLTINNLDSGKGAGRWQKPHTGHRLLWAPENGDREAGGKMKAGKEVEETEAKGNNKRDRATAMQRPKGNGNRAQEMPRWRIDQQTGKRICDIIWQRAKFLNLQRVYKSVKLRQREKKGRDIRTSFRKKYKWPILIWKRCLTHTLLRKIKEKSEEMLQRRTELCY